MTGERLFFSDCHLDPARPETSEQLTRFLTVRANHAESIYILGDLFEVWLGDDDPAVAHQPVLYALERLARQTPVFFIAGNRDFLLGGEFAMRTGIRMLPEPQRITVGSHEVLLVHGDTLCTDDLDYQRFRALVRDPVWQTDFLSKTLDERRRIAAGLRSDSSEAMTTKAPEIMDVNEQAVAACFQQYAVDTLIHGHTHRPAVHHYPDGLTRYVLGDWNPGPSYLAWNEEIGFELIDPRA